MSWQYKRPQDTHWMTLSEADSQDIDDWYSETKRNKTTGQRVFHCFGDGQTAFVNFENMRTSCGSWKCQKGENIDQPATWCMPSWLVTFLNGPIVVHKHLDFIIRRH